MSEILFTPVAVLSLLSNIEELKDVEVSIIDVSDSDIHVNIGGSRYIIPTSDAAEVQVSNDALETINDVSIDTYQDLEDSGSIELRDVNGGVIAEMAKTLLVGGLVRLTNKILNK